nr:MAG TPA: ubiquitin-binding zinc finger protein [Caudoviricetes sp.]
MICDRCGELFPHPDWTDFMGVLEPDARKAKGLPCDWQTGMDVFRWWMEDDNISGQLSMDDFMEDNNV